MDKIRPVKRSDEIVLRIKDRIVQGDYKPGDKLPSEKDLAQQYGVSRMSVREALAVLASAQLIEIRHGEGSFVQKADIAHFIPPLTVSLLPLKQAILDLLEVRMILEASAAELAAERAGDTDLAAMDSALQGFGQEIAAQRSGAQYDVQLHTAIAQATNNSVLVEVMTRIKDLITEGMRYTLEQNIGNLRKNRQVYDEHAAIIEAIRQHNAPLAREAMLTHLYNVRRKLLEEIRTVSGDLA